METRGIEIAGDATYQRLLQIATTSCGHDVADPAGLTKERILSVEHPVVCLYGQQSPFQPLCQFLVDNLPNCETAIVPEAEHFAYEENPADFVRLANEKLCQLAGIAAVEPVVDVDPRRVRRQQTLFTKQ